MPLTLDERSVLVLDLDDTLFDERDYVHSGLRAVGQLVRSLYGEEVAEDLVSSYESGTTDTFGELCTRLGLPSEVKPQLLAEYRNHAPSIAFRPGAAKLIDGARSAGAGIAVITDGRSVTQRQKLRALGLLGALDYVGISEEVGVGKPETRAFVQVMNLFPGRRCCYVGDNPAKDFIAPNSLGWLTIGVRNPRGIHHGSHGSPATAPSSWVEALTDLVTTAD